MSERKMSATVLLTKPSDQNTSYSQFQSMKDNRTALSSINTNSSTGIINNNNTSSGSGISSPPSSSLSPRLSPRMNNSRPNTLYQHNVKPYQIKFSNGITSNNTVSNQYTTNISNQ